MGKSPIPDVPGSTSTLRRVITGRICKLRETLRVLPSSSLDSYKLMETQMHKTGACRFIQLDEKFPFCVCFSFLVSSH